MNQDKTLQIVNICLQIDMIAQQTYFLLASITDDHEMKNFWLEMSEEENTHIRFWQRFRELAQKWQLPDVFENPDKVIIELKSIIPKAESLLDRCKEQRDFITSITLAYRLEFYLLHPAFEVLFHFLGTAVGGTNPEETYEAHINKLIDRLNKTAETSPELELLGETLQRLWQENKKLAHQVATDSLTELLNRRGFFTIATQMSHLAHRQGVTVGILMIDIDDFKKVNDNYGHQIGDIVLQTVAQAITATSRASDIIGRYGGEEFCLFMPDTEAGAIAKTAERIRIAILESKPNDIGVTISIGGVFGQIGPNTPESLHLMLQQADKNLYTAKKDGKNRVVMHQYQPS